MTFCISKDQTRCCSGAEAQASVYVKSKWATQGWGNWGKPQRRRQSIIYQTPVLLDEQVGCCNPNPFFRATGGLRAVDVPVSISTNFTRNISKKPFRLVCKHQLCRSIPSVATCTPSFPTTLDNLNYAPPTKHDPSTVCHPQHEFIMPNVGKGLSLWCQSLYTPGYPATRQQSLQRMWRVVLKNVWWRSLGEMQLPKSSSQLQQPLSTTQLFQLE